MTTLLDMAAVAARLDVHYDTLRKHWRGWVAARGFPAPVEVAPYRWNPASLDAYTARREAENRALVLQGLARLKSETAAPANDHDAPAAAPSPTARARRIEDRQRNAVHQLMQGGFA